MKTDFANGERLFAEDLNDNFSETDSRLNTAGTDASGLVSGTVNNARLPVLEHSKMPSGSILQVVQGEYTTPKTVSDQNYVNADIELSITPKFADSKIYVVGSFKYQMYRHDDDGTAFFKILRDGSTTVREEHQGFQADNVTLVYDIGVMTMDQLDSPATTDEVTYSVQFRHGSSNQPRTVTINSSGSSRLTLFEIAG